MAQYLKLWLKLITMRLLKTTALILLIAALPVKYASAQAMGREYKTALGLKFYPGAITLKSFIKNNRALEGLGYFWEWGGRITGLYEFHGDIKGANGLKWYAGPGVHVSFWNDRYNKRYGNAGTGIGIDGVLGLDYKFNRAPINMSLDWQPSWNFGNDAFEGFSGNWGGLAVRYTF